MPLLLEMPSAGSLILAIAVAILTALSAIQWKQKQSMRLLKEQAEADVATAQRAASEWKGVADTSATTVRFAESELGIVRERCERLEATTKTQGEELISLRARTDLDALSKMMVAESRRSQEMHEAILHGLERLADAVADMGKSVDNLTQRDAERDERYAVLINQQAELIKSLQSQVNLKEAMPARRRAGAL